MRFENTFMRKYIEVLKGWGRQDGSTFWARGGDERGTNSSVSGGKRNLVSDRSIKADGEENLCS